MELLLGGLYTILIGLLARVFRRRWLPEERQYFTERLFARVPVIRLLKPRRLMDWTGLFLCYLGALLVVLGVVSLVIPR